MAGNGLWSKLSCEELPNGKGGVDVKVDGSSKPAAGGTTTTISGVLHEDGKVDGEMTMRDNGALEMHARTDGTGATSIPLPEGKTLADVAKDAITAPAQACKRALSFVPGVSG